MSLDTELCLYHRTLQRQTNSIKSCCGNFSGSKSQEIITATSNTLTVYKVDTSEGKLNKIVIKQVFATIRAISSFKIAGSGKDYLAVTSDAGNLSILEFDLSTLSFKALFNEPYFKSGIRRLSPGQYLSADASGRAILATAVERNKLCYVVNRDLDNNLVITSPLEANRSNILTIETIGLDVGFENPLFAAIEIDYTENEDSKTTEFQRFLTYYELDLGLNHILLKNSEPISNSSNYMIQVPGGSDGPSGLLLCANNSVSYRNLYHDSRVSVSIPKVENDSNKDVFVVSGIVHKMKRNFFFLLQTNLGDLFKVEILEDERLVLTISYFDTIPLTSSLIILKSGFMLADTEYGDKLFYQFEKLGSDDPFTSSTDSNLEQWSFQRSEELENLLLVDLLESMNPIVDSKVANDGTSTNIYALTGVGQSSALRVLQYGVSIEEIVESELPPLSHKVFTTKTRKNDSFDKYLIISFVDTTLVLSIGDSVEEVTDSGIALNQHTLEIMQIGDKSIVQIHSNGILVIQDLEVVREWLPPAGIKIVCSSATNKQIAIGLSNDELIYFEVDEYDRLIEYSEHKTFRSTLVSLSLGKQPEGKMKSPFLVVGCKDSTIRVLNTSPENTLESMSLQALSSVPRSLLVSSMKNQLYVHIGLDNGVYIRALVDERTGTLSDSRTKYLGSKPVTLNQVSYENTSIVLAFSTHAWVAHELYNFEINKLLVNDLHYGSTFNSEDITDGVVGIHKRKLTIFKLKNPLNPFTSTSIQLKTTPKRISKHEDYLYITERSGGQSLIEKINSKNGEVEASIDLEFGDFILTSEIIRFESRDNSPYLLVSVTKEPSNEADQCTESWIYTYDLDLKFLHKTSFSDLVYTLAFFQGKCLVGVNNHLRLYDIGMRQLLSKCVTKVDALTKIVRIETQGHRVYVADVRESITFLVYKSELNQFVPFIDDQLARHVTSFKVLDYYTVVVGDRFGNVSILRCDQETSDLSDQNATFLTSQGSSLNGAPKKLQNLCNFFIDDIPTSFNKDYLTSGGQDVVIYTGLQGTIGLFIPIQTKTDIRFFIKLQKAMRLHAPDLLKRDNLKYRSYYQPIKNVIDGDLVEQFNDLPTDLKVAISKEVGKLPKDITRKLFEVRALST